MLPIQSILPDFKKQLLLNNQVILQAPPGAGKSTFLPLTMLQEQWFSGRILMLEPRRLAARNIAHFLAKQLHQSVGEQVGYRLRGESKVSKKTQLEIVTEGVLIRLLQADPELAGYDVIIFDEFHERNLQADLGLALALDSQESLREDLRLLVMSATLDNQALTAHMPAAVSVACSGRSYPIDYIYKPINSAHVDLNSALISVIKEAYTQQSGSILVFVAGKKEILRCCGELQRWVTAEQLPLLVAPLYGQLTLDQQQLAIKATPQQQRKIVVATNIAETSLTIDGISVVVDSGMERRVNFQAAYGVSKLRTQKISAASATQRAGRAGRLGPGVCYRLWSKESRLVAQHEVPILTSELTALLLEASVWGVSDLTELPLVTQPHSQNLLVAKALLQQISAIDESGRSTTHGEQIVSFGLSPRIGHMLIKAQQLQQEHKLKNLVAVACLLAAVIESNETSSDDIVSRISRPSQAVKQQFKLLLRKCAYDLNTLPTLQQLPLHWCGLLLAIAYPDRIAKQRDNSSGEYLLSNGLGAVLKRDSILQGEGMLVVNDLALSEGKQSSLVFSAAAVELDDIKSYLGHYLQEREHLFWSISDTRLIAEKRVMLGKIPLSRTPLKQVSEQQKQQALLNALQQHGLSLLPWREQDKALLVRLRYAQQQYNKSDFDFSEATLISELDNWLAPFCVGISQPDQLKKIDLQAALMSRLNWDEQQQFEKDFPKTLQVPTGSNIRLTYREELPPLLSVRMQELYGQADTPSIFNEQIKVQIALLSPAMKPLQLTQNLSSFWAGAYKEVQKEMKGRYPKHYWPDDPAAATATRKTKKYIQ